MEKNQSLSIPRRTNLCEYFIGSPFIRPIGPIKAVAGADVTLHCPYSGYPIDSVRWEIHGQVVVPDLRHHFTEGEFVLREFLMLMYVIIRR